MSTTSQPTVTFVADDASDVLGLIVALDGRKIGRVKKSSQHSDRWGAVSVHRTPAFGGGTNAVSDHYTSRTRKAAAAFLVTADERFGADR